MNENKNIPSTVVRPMPQYLPMEAELQPHGQISVPETQEVPLREYFRVIVKYRTLISASVIVSALLALIYAFTATPYYTAEAKLRIGTYEPVLTAARIEDLLQEKSKESTYLETQIQELKSLSLADRVLQDPGIKEMLEREKSKNFLRRIFRGHSSEELSPELSAGLGYKAPVDQLRDYLDSVKVTPVRRTSLVLVSATAAHPVVAAQIANRHVAEYIDWVRQARIDRQSRGLTFLRSQADELRDKVADLEREMADYAEANSIVAVNKDENITAQKMSQLNKLLTDATAKRIEAEHAYQEAGRALKDASAGFDDPSTQSMRTELAKAEAEYQQFSAKFTENYPKVQQLRSQIGALKRSIESQRGQIVSGLKAKMLAAAEEEKNLKEELEQQKSQAFELSKRQVQYNVLNRDLTTSRELLNNILKEIKETSLAVESNASNISIVDKAVVPLHPGYPNKKLILLLGLCAGAGIGLALAFILAHIDNTIRTPEDVVEQINLPNLGVVPSFELGEESAAETQSITARTLSGTKEIIPVRAAQAPIVFVNDPKSLAAEAYRTIRTGLLLSQAGEPPRVILMTSAESSEGKTTSAVNLAASLAGAGGRVVLVDADLRRPSVHKHFGIRTHEPGLVEIVTGLADIEQVVIPDVVKRVSLVRSGKIPPNPAELLGAREMLDVLNALAAVYDYVVVDSPPVLPVTDSVILSRYVDGVVLVVRGASTPKKVVNDAKRRLQSVGSKILGVVLNDVDINGGDYYYYNRYYYSYYRDDAGAREKPRRRTSPAGKSAAAG